MKLYTALATVAVLALAFSTTISAAGSTAFGPAQIAAAKTAADHEALAKAYEDEASELDRKVELHKSMGTTYKAGKSASVVGNHCVRIATDFKAAAQEYRALAAEHHKLAQKAGK